MRAFRKLAPALLLASIATAAAAADVKVGITASITGPFSIWGKEYQEAIDLFLAENNGRAGKHNVTVIYRDIGGMNPPRARQLAQELVVREKVAVLGGHELTPNVLAVADVINQAKIPFVIFNTGTAMVTDKSAFYVRVSPTQWSNYFPLSQWVARQGTRRCVSIAADYAPGHDSLAAIRKGFESGGGKILEDIKVPLDANDFSPYLQRVRDSSPQCAFMFMPFGPMSVAFTKAYADRGLLRDGIRLYGQSETAETDLPALGEAVVGVVTAQPYGPHVDNPRNEAFVKAFQAKYGKDRLPSFIHVYAYDGMKVIFEMIKATDGRPDGAKAIAAAKGMKWDSPRGPVSIEPATREIVQNIYIRRVVKENGTLYNKTIHVLENQKEPWHALQK